MKTETRKASQIYGRQNKLLHKAFATAGFPYNDDKHIWLNLFKQIAGRAVKGLSNMTLAERHKLIVHFQKQGQRLYAPGVPVKVRNWKKGDKEVEYEWREDDDPQIRMIYAMWAELGYAPKKLRGLCFKRFNRDDPRWLTNEQLMTLFNIVRARARQKGVANYYGRTENRRISNRRMSKGN